jgi:hypothetical protein
MKKIKDFTAIIVDGSECCQHVNRNRHCVDAIVPVKNGKIPATYICGRCGNIIDMTDSIRQDILKNKFILETGNYGRMPVTVEGVEMSASTVEYS